MDFTVTTKTKAQAVNKAILAHLAPGKQILLPLAWDEQGYIKGGLLVGHLESRQLVLIDYDLSGKRDRITNPDGQLANGLGYKMITEYFCA